MLDAADYITPETHPAFLAIGATDVGKFFAADCQTMAAECAQFAAAPAEWKPDTAAVLLEAYTGRAIWLAGQVFLIAWATGLGRASAAEFASIISYFAGDTVLREHINAGNTDRDYVEFMSWTFVEDFDAAFAKLMATAAFEMPHTPH